MAGEMEVVETELLGSTLYTSWVAAPTVMSKLVDVYEIGAGDESLEVVLYQEPDIPWAELAFPSGEYALRRFLDDRKNSRTGMHLTEVGRRKGLLVAK